MPRKVNKEKDEAARRLLDEILTDHSGTLGLIIEAVLETKDGADVPRYAGASDKGLGGFRCEYFALPAVVTLMADCERVVDDFKLTMKDTGAVVKFKDLRLPPDVRAKYRSRLIQDATYMAVYQLLFQMREALQEACESNFDTALTTAGAVVAESLYRDLRSHGVGRPDAREVIKDETAKAGKRRAQYIARVLKSTPSVILEGRRGRLKGSRLKTAEVYDAVMRHGGEDAKAEDVARDLGISTRQLYNIQAGEGFSGAGGWRDFTGHVARHSDRK